MLKKLLIVLLGCCGMAAAHGEETQKRVIDAPANVVVTDDGHTTVVVVTDSLGNTSKIKLVEGDGTPVRVNIWNIGGASSRPKEPDGRGAAVIDSIWELIPMQSKQAKIRRQIEFREEFGRLIYGGVTVPVDADPAIGTGWEIGIGQAYSIAVQPWRNGPSLSVGAGFGFRRFSVKSPYMLVSDGGKLDVAEAPADARDISGGITSFGLHFPLMLTQRICYHFTVSAGVWLNLNTYTRASARYSIGDDRAKYSYKHLDQRLLSLDYVGQIGFSPVVSAYVRYSPHSAFKGGAGPAFNPLSAGVMFNF